MKFIILTIMLILLTSCGGGFSTDFRFPIPDVVVPPNIVISPPEIPERPVSDEVIALINGLTICVVVFPTPENCNYEYSTLADFEELGLPDSYVIQYSPSRVLERYYFKLEGYYYYQIMLINDIVINIIDMLAT